MLGNPRDVFREKRPKSRGDTYKGPKGETTRRSVIFVFDNTPLDPKQELYKLATDECDVIEEFLPYPQVGHSPLSATFQIPLWASTSGTINQRDTMS